MRVIVFEHSVDVIFAGGAQQEGCGGQGREHELMHKRTITLHRQSYF